MIPWPFDVTYTWSPTKPLVLVFNNEKLNVFKTNGGKIQRKEYIRAQDIRNCDIIIYHIYGIWYHRISYDIIHDPAGHWFHATSHYCDVIISKFLLITWHQLWYTLISPKISHYSDIICDFIAKITWLISQEGVKTSIYTDITYDIMCSGKLFLWCHLIS